MLLDWTGREIRADKRGAETRTRLESDEKGDGLAMEWVPAAHVTRWVATQALLGLLLESQASKIAPRTARSLESKAVANGDDMGIVSLSFQRL